jgi:uracil-DNA glycosylase
VYLGNTLLCYRTGWDTVGTRNLSPRSFRNCREHLTRHVEAVAPEVVVTFGRNSCTTMASILKGVDDSNQAILTSLQRDELSLGAVMTDFYKRARPPRGIQGRLERLSLTFVPLYHPSYGHANRYEGDYEALKVLLRDTPASVT